MKNGPNPLPDDPLWYKDAIFYELRVRSFYDSNGDGVGDFPGLTRKLDYLRDLGITTIWLLPFYPSPMRDDGYDISDYTGVHPVCGTLNDFRTFLREAHERGLRVVTELVLNHTSDQHPWFQRARRSPPGSTYRDFYVWSDTPERYKDARVIFKDFELSNWTWDPVAKAYFWHRFYSHQPDLNYDNPAVRRAALRAVHFWLGMGVDGLRLDAVPYLFEREGTTCENLPETHAYLRELRRHIDANFPNRMLLAEANQWPEDAVAYLEGGKECHMAFHFPIMPRMFMAVRMEDRFPLTDIWAQTPPIDESCQWAIFLRNHDELTLEMVTEEERDFMYRAYARESRMRVNLGIRRRLAPLLGNNRRAMELMNGLLLSLPGTPVIYYGDEIGMGDNIYLGDRDGVRTPMQWSGDRNAGFSATDPQRLILPVIIDHEYHYQTVNVENQEHNLHSMLWWMRRVIALRKRFKAFGRGTVEFLSPENPRVLAFLRIYQDERILVVANLSRFVQYVELDLARFKGMVPVELFGRTEFPVITEKPYLLMLGPHLFDWFSIQPPRRAPEVVEVAHNEVPRIETSAGWENFMRGEGWEMLGKVMPDFLPRCRWFRSKARSIKTVKVADALPLIEGRGGAHLVLANVEYSNAEPETYVVPLALGADGVSSEPEHPELTVAHLRLSGGRNNVVEGRLFEASADPQFASALLELVERRRRLRGQSGELIASASPAWRALRGDRESQCEPRALKAEQTNSSVVYGDRLILKLFRMLDPGINPDLEVGRMFTTHTHFAHTPPLAGWLEYQAGLEERRTVGVLYGFIPNQGDAWTHAQGELSQYFERALTHKNRKVELPAKPLVRLVAEDRPGSMVAEAIGAFLETAGLLGRRTAELHLALAAAADDPDFIPEPYSALYQRSEYQSMRNLAGQVFRMLRARLPLLPEAERGPASELLANQDRVTAYFQDFLQKRFSVTRIRTHGDLHLGQVLHAGKDFAIIDFEGEPARPLSERRRKRSALRDVSGMLRSFHYAALGSMLEHLQTGSLSPSVLDALGPWAQLWQVWASWAFLKEYLNTAGEANFIPRDREELRILLDTFLLDKAIYELGYEMNNRPDWMAIPLQGISQVLGGTI
ncbi:MAG TPA: maltose alpha-D-glucosyltransferase [Candidatus Binataceae bacterium]|nr:maltose alpha-D-glucosyltransferase [Candidatus Binataceae bacterium]